MFDPSDPPSRGYSAREVSERSMERVWMEAGVGDDVELN
jgi:hypothetical protein